MALVERETPERRTLRKLTTELQPQAPTGLPAGPLPPRTPEPVEEEGGGLGGFFRKAGDIILDSPVLPGGSSLRELGSGVEAIAKPFEAITQLARRGTESLPSDFVPQGGALDLFSQALQVGRKPEEERGEFKPSTDLIDSFNQLVELERDEPFLAQILGGAITDPTIAFGGGKSAISATKVLARETPEVAARILKEEVGAIGPREGLERLKNWITNSGADNADVLDGVPKEVTTRITTMADAQAAQLNVAVTKVNNALQQATIKRGVLKRAQKLERGKRVEAASDRLLEFDDPQEAFAAARRELSGELAPRTSDDLVDLIDDVDIQVMANHIRTTDTLPIGPRGFFSRLNGEAALRKFTTGEILQPAEIKLLKQLFGPEFGKQVVKRQPLARKILEGVGEAVNLPRAILTGIWDMSMPLRQGAVLLPTHPVRSAEAAGKMFKAFFSDNVSRAAEEAIELMPTRDLMQQSGLQLTERFGILTAREEGFMSNWINTIPVLKTLAKVTFDPASRAAHTYLNMLRANVFNDWALKQMRAGKTFESHPQDYEAMGRFINWATGRGPLPASVEQFAPILNGGLFSPKLLTSRFAMPFAPFIGPWRGAGAVSKGLRAKMALDLAAFVGSGLAILTLMSRMPGVEVEADPRSSDFGQIKIGGTRFDIWAGFRPVATLYVKLISGQTKSPISDQVKSAEWQDTMSRFLRSKLAPVPGFGVSVFTEESFLGEPVETRREQLDAFADNLAPLFIQDTVEAFQEDGLLLGASAGLGAFFGLGTTSFSGLTNIRDEGAQELFGKNYRDLGPRDKDEVEALPDVQGKIVEIDSRSRGVDPQEQATNAFDQLNRIRSEKNDELLEKMVAGQRGAALRNSLKSVKTELWAGSQALFSPEVEVQLRKRKETTIEELRRLYWSSTPLENPATGELDFAHQDKQRNEVLQRAQDLGVDPEDVKQRSRVFENDSVQQLMDLYNSDLDQLRTLWKGSNDMVRSRLSNDRKLIWDEFLSSRSPTDKSNLRKRHPWLSKATSLRNTIRERARTANPNYDRIMIRWEYSVVPQSEAGQQLQQQLFPVEGLTTP